MYADDTPAHAPRVTNLFEHTSHDVARRRETDPLAAAGSGEDEGVDARIIGHRKDLNDERLMGGRVFFQHANPEFCEKIKKDGNAEIERIRLMYRERQAILKTRAR